MDTKKQKKKIEKDEAATAFHVKAENVNVVGVGNLRVVIFKEDDSYFAQGLEIDYAAAGESIEDVKRRFEQGLADTLHAHARVFNDISGFLRVAPQEVWNEFLSIGGCSKHRFSCVTIGTQPLAVPAETSVSFPYKGIDFYMPEMAQA
jgi:hypothetical protein